MGWSLGWGGGCGTPATDPERLRAGIRARPRLNLPGHARETIPGGAVKIAPGSRLGPYEVIGALGAGGMGEVWRARDPRLGRDVAIKVLPAALANDPERRARFERECRLLASLNHPHVASVLGLEDADGAA